MQKSEAGSQKSNIRRMRKKNIYVLCALPLVLVTGCATTPKLPPHPPQHVYKQEQVQTTSANSLWTDRASLYEDVKARRLNDLVTINVIENITGSGTADTTTSRNSSVDAGFDTFLGASTSIKGIPFFGKGKAFSPKIVGSMQDDFKGTGQTTRAGMLIGTITARIVDVMPNGNLLIESRKDITINREKQILVLRGMIRPEDVANDNTIPSDRIAGSEVYFVGDGVLQDKQGPGWMVKFLDNAWPF